MSNYKKNIIIFIGLSLFSSMLNYLSQMLLGRLLSVEIYGIINSIFSFSLIIAAPGTTLSMIMTRRVVEEQEKIEIYIAKLIKVCLSIVIFVFPISIVFRSFFLNIIKTDDLFIIVATLLFTCLGYFPVAFSGMFTALNRYVLAGAIGIFLPLFKIISVGVIKISKVNESYSISVILMFMLIGCIVSVIYVLFFMIKNKYIHSKKENILKESKVYLKPEYIWMLMSNFLMVLLSNLDIMILNYLYTPEKVGYYSSVMLFGKIVFYIATSLVTAILPYIVKLKYEEKKQKKLLFITCLLVTSICIACFLPLNIGGDFFITLVFTEKFLPAKSYLMITSVIASILSLITVLMNYMIANNRQKTFVIIMGVCIISIILNCLTFSYNPISTLIILSANLFLGGIICCIMCFFTVKKKERKL